MLNKTESRVMDYIYEKCREEQKVLFTPKELLSSLMPKTELTAKELDVVMNNLVLDDYIDITQGTKEGRVYFLIGLTIKGAAYDRERKARKSARLRTIAFRLLLAVAAGVVSFGMYRLLSGVLGLN